jgi:hypothetical protein
LLLLVLTIGILPLGFVVTLAKLAFDEWRIVRARVQDPAKYNPTDR